MAVKDNTTGLLNQTRLAQITSQLYERRRLAYVCVDLDWSVQEVSDNLSDFGFTDLSIGSDVTDTIDFLVGVDIQQSLDLPMISSPSDLPIRVMLIPDDDTLTIVILDAQEEYYQRKLLQQKANENQLLLDTQQKLMTEIESAKQELLLKNTQLHDATRLQSSFLSGVSHEFRTPLASIIGYTNLLVANKDYSEEESTSEYLAAIMRSSKHLLSLIENLLDHGKYDSGEIRLNPKATNLQELFKEVALLMAPLAETKNIQFNLDLKITEGQTFLVDDSRLRQCLINLIGNAIKFTDLGGVVVRASTSNDMLNVVIDDTGIGIQKPHLDKVRQPFWQAPDTGKAGTGLGLTITERIIELMGGSLLIKSQYKQGSNISFQILAPELCADTPRQSEARKSQSTSCHVLFAEDDDDIARLVVLMLEESTIKVSRVENGALAVERLHKADFDLVLMDLHMPVMDGYTAVEMIRADDNQIPIIIMTASAIETDRQRAQNLGCDGYLVKPIDIDDLLLMISQLVSEQKAASLLAIESH